jgi:hypothetical protein
MLALHFGKTKLLHKTTCSIFIDLIEKRCDADYEFFSVVTLDDALNDYNNTIDFIRKIENVVVNNSNVPTIKEG